MVRVVLLLQLRRPAEIELAVFSNQSNVLPGNLKYRIRFRNITT